MSSSDSTMVRRQLGRRLRVLRKEARKTREDVSVAKIASHSKLERIEYGLTTVKSADVRELCRFYGADAETAEALVALCPGTLEPGWWEEYGNVVKPHFALYIGLESGASEIRAYEPDLVWGLLQTEDYARAIENVFVDTPDDVLVERRVALRMERQRTVLHRERPPKIHVILGETALMTRADPTMMRAQLEHLHALSSLDHLDLRILTHSAGLHPGVKGTFTIMDFDDPLDPPVTYLETYDGARYAERPAQIERHRRRFARLQEMSVPFQEYRQ